MTTPRIGSLCSGAGMLDVAVTDVLGGSVAWHCEYEPPSAKAPRPSQAAAKVLAHHWPDVPNHGDLTAVDWATVEPVDIVTAGYPCQPDSAAGKRLGRDDDRWIWPAVRDAIRDLGPGLVVLENVAGHLGRGFPGVVGDLASIGYDARWCCVPASAVGAPHRRERLFVVAYPSTDSAGNRWHEGRAEPAGQFGRPDDALSGDAPADPAGDGLVRDPGITGSGAACGERERVAAGSDRGASPTDAHRHPVRQQPEPVTRRGGPTGAGLDRGAATDARLTGDVQARLMGLGYCEDAENGRTRPGQVLRRMLGTVDPQEVQRPTGGSGGLPASAELLTGVCEHQGDCRPGHPSLAGEALSGAGLRDMRSEASPSRSPRRSKPREQQPGEPADSLFFLPPETALAGGPAEADGGGPSRPCDCGCAVWGKYAPAIRRWEMVLGRLAPEPTELSPKGSRRLSASLSEWMMGWPDGWVTAVPGLSRNDQLRVVGNGVVPHAAAAALRWLLL